MNSADRKRKQSQKQRDRSPVVPLTTTGGGGGCQRRRFGLTLVLHGAGVLLLLLRRTHRRASGRWGAAQGPGPPLDPVRGAGGSRWSSHGRGWRHSRTLSEEPWQSATQDQWEEPCTSHDLLFSPAGRRRRRQGHPPAGSRPGPGPTRRGPPQRS